MSIAPAAVGWVVFGVVASAWPDRPGESRALVMLGLAVSTPAALALAALSGDAGRRLLAPRRGRIELQRDRLIIHDRWMLRRPMEIWRSELLAMERAPRLAMFEYTAFAGEAGRDLGARGPLLDWGTRPNAMLVLRKPRQFVEAIRTLPGQTPLVPISTTAVSDRLLLRIADEKEGFRRLDAWMIGAAWTAPPPRPRPVSHWHGCLRSVALGVGALAGLAMMCAGLALGAPA